MNLQETVSAILKKEVSIEDALIFAKDNFGILTTYIRENDPRFPNGFENWAETHYEITAMIQEHLKNQVDGRTWTDVVLDTEEAHGMGGLWILANAWTNEFEQLHKGREWDGDWFDELEDFLSKKNRGE